MDVDSIEMIRLTNSSSEVEPGCLQILEVALEDCHSLRVGQLQEMLPLSSHSLILSLLPRHLLTEGLECDTGAKPKKTSYHCI